METVHTQKTERFRRLRGGEMSFDQHPLLVLWELTQACSLVCAHCRACATPARSAQELTTDEGKALLRELRAMETPLVVLTGGDPSLRPDLIELVSYGSSLGLAMAVTPSGTPGTTTELLASLKQAGLSRLAVSIDGPDAATHDAFRGVVGSFDESVRILKTARDLSIEVQVNTTISPRNVDALEAMAAFVASMGAVLWSVFVVVPTGRADSKLLLTPERLEAALEQLAEMSEQLPYAIKTTGAPHFRRVLLQKKNDRNTIGLFHDVDEHGVVRGMRGVTDGVGVLFISHEGDIFPSGFMPVKAGNVRTDSVTRVYRESPLFRSLRNFDALEGKCGDCAFRRVCGGSRARAFAMQGSPMAEDPLCAYEPRTRRTRTTEKEP